MNKKYYLDGSRWVDMIYDVLTTISDANIVIANIHGMALFNNKSALNRCVSCSSAGSGPTRF